MGTTVIELQPGQPGNGLDYDPAEPLPYPIVVGEDNRCENVPGYPLRNRDAERSALPILVGFQPDATTQRVDVDVDVDVDAWRTDPEVAVGMAPVFYEPGGFSDGMFNLAVVITSVRTVELAGS